MPFITIRTNVTISEDIRSNLQTALGKAITDIPGKSERWLMTELAGDCTLSFQGDSKKPIAFVGVSIYGHVKPESCSRLTADICKILESELSIPGENVYVRYLETDKWGWNGENF